MKVLAVHEDLLVVSSRLWQQSAALVKAPGQSEAFLIDSPILPDELEMTASLAGQAGFSLAGLIATSGDWRKLLGKFAAPDAAIACAESTASYLQANPGLPQRQLRDFDDLHFVDRQRAALSLGQVQSLPVPGKLELGEGFEIELHEASGRTADGLIAYVPWARTLLCGSYLSPFEIPIWQSDRGGSKAAYQQTLRALGELIERSDWVVVANGGALDAQRAMAIWREDMEYLKSGTLPLARKSQRFKQIDQLNQSHR